VRLYKFNILQTQHIILHLTNNKSFAVMYTVFLRSCNIYKGSKIETWLVVTADH